MSSLRVLEGGTSLDTRGEAAFVKSPVEQLRAGTEQGAIALAEVKRLMDQLQQASGEGSGAVEVDDLSTKIARIQAELGAITREVEKRQKEATMNERWGTVLEEKKGHDLRFEKSTKAIGVLFEQVFQTMDWEARPVRPFSEVNLDSFTQLNVQLVARQEEIRARLFDKESPASAEEAAELMKGYLAFEEELGCPDLLSTAKLLRQEAYEEHSIELKYFEARIVTFWNKVYPGTATSKDDIDLSKEFPADADPAVVAEIKALIEEAVANDERREERTREAYHFSDNVEWVRNIPRWILSRTVEAERFYPHELRDKLMEKGKEPFVNEYIARTVHPEIERLIREQGLNPVVGQEFEEQMRAAYLTEGFFRYKDENKTKDHRLIATEIYAKGRHNYVSMTNDYAGYILGLTELDTAERLRTLQETIFAAGKNDASKNFLKKRYSEVKELSDRLYDAEDDAMKHLYFGDDASLAHARVQEGVLPMEALLSKNNKEILVALKKWTGKEPARTIYKEIGIMTHFNEATLEAIEPSLEDLSSSPALVPQVYLLLRTSPVQECVSIVRTLADLKRRQGEMGIELFLQMSRMSETASLGERVTFIDEIIADQVSERLSRPVFDAILKDLLRVPREKRKMYIDVVQRVDTSPSQAMQRIKLELAEQLTQVEDPIKAYESIEQVFLKNHLPAVGKVFRIFEILHPPEVLEAKLSKNEDLSPVLKAQGHRERMMTIYKDLLSVHVDSGNPSLRQYVESIIQAEPVMAALEMGGVETLSPSQKEQLKQFCRKMKAMYENSQLGRSEQAVVEGKGETDEELLRIYTEWKTSLKVAPGQSVSARVAEMFFKPLGITSLQEVIQRMDQKKQSADARSRALVAQAKNGELTIQGEDLLKAVNEAYITEIIQNGSVAKEYLGSGAATDATPCDTDLSRVTPADAQLGLTGAIMNSIAKDQTYGKLLFVLRPDDRLLQTTSKQTPEEVRALARKESGKQELFRTAVLDQERHVGIRTGFPVTDVQFMIMRNELAQDTKQREHIFMEIAQGGFYIPITNEKGTIIFTPELYDEYRRTYAGIAVVGKESPAAVPLKEEDEYERRISGPSGETARKQEDIEVIRKMTGSIHGTIEQTLATLGVQLHEATGDSVTGAELFDVGSSARFTNVPGSYDFDINVRLDAQDLKQVTVVMQQIQKAFHATRFEEYQSGTGHQLRLYGAKVNGEEVDIDLAFTSKSELVVFNSHDAAAARLEAIRTEQGETAYERILTNISVAKQILKESHAYKRLEDGGIGGMGVENWILNHQGSLFEACRSLIRAAKDEQGKTRTFTDFQDRYPILDPGINEKYRKHDNYTRLLNESAYQKMVAGIEAFLEKMEGQTNQSFAQAA